MADLSKVKVLGTTYNLKDAKSRADLETLLGTHALEALGAAAWLGVDSTLTDSGTGVATSGTIKSYVDSMIETIPEFDVVVVTGNLPTASADTFHKIYLQDASSPSSPNLYMEWITVRSGTDPNYTYSWEKIGDTSMDLTVYVQKSTTIAGVDLQDNITKQELQTALELGDMAYADEGEVDVPTQTVTGLTATGTLNPTLSGDLATTATNATLTKADLTPAGTVTAKATDGSFSAVKTVEFVAANDGSIQISGTNAASAVTFTGNTTATVSHQTAAGSLPSLTGQSYTAPSLGTATTDNFTTEGVVASVGTGDDAETLIIANASTSAAVTAQGAFTAGNVDFGTFTAGTLPTFEDVTVVDSLGTAEAAAQVFTGNKYNLNTTTDTALKDVEFTGTTVTNALVTAVSYDKTTIGTLAVDPINAALDVDDVVIPAQNDLTVTPKASV